jgi:SHS2 domain-containing protein
VEHTADIAAAISGATLPILFRNASCALADLICDRRTVRPRRRLRVAVEGAGTEDLLVRWLTELLYLHESRSWVFSSFKLDRVDRRRMTACGSAAGEPYDASRHRLMREVKAVTYHQIRLVRSRGIWRVRIVFDV